ncbi:MAG: TetR/AcrR family transcriptional regulator [Methylovirgula sp.]|uniref:TetR/AcrR family transcriptional regulator n=1 Tax=Methylovirgula sp. TaxID=1978224 RepID=UPI003076097F
MTQPRAPAREKGRARVAALMSAAVATLVERGFEATTMTEIAARAGASIGTLYLFFATKDVLAQAILAETAGDLSARLDGLSERAAGLTPAQIADALFAELAAFLDEHPVYSILLDVPGDEGWRRPVRARRRQQISALFAQAKPALPAKQVERLAVIVPQLMRIAFTLDAKQRIGVLEELRLMLSHHLTAAVT